MSADKPVIIQMRTPSGVATHSAAPARNRGEAIRIADDFAHYICTGTGYRPSRSTAVETESNWTVNYVAVAS